MKDIYKKTPQVSYLIVRLDYFPLRSGIKKASLLSPLLFTTTLGNLAKAISKRKKTTSIIDGKKYNNSSHRWHDLVYLKETTKKLLEQINESAH